MSDQYLVLGDAPKKEDLKNLPGSDMHLMINNLSAGYGKMEILHDFDLFVMGRKLLADPFLPQKLQDNQDSLIRPCIYCYVCVSKIFINQPMCALSIPLWVENLKIKICIQNLKKTKIL